MCIRDSTWAAPAGGGGGGSIAGLTQSGGNLLYTPQTANGPATFRVTNLAAATIWDFGVATDGTTPMIHASGLSSDLNYTIRGGTVNTVINAPAGAGYFANGGTVTGYWDVGVFAVNGIFSFYGATDVGFGRTSAGVAEINNFTAGQFGQLNVGIRDSGTTTVQSGLVTNRQSTGTPGVGFGAGILFDQNSSTTANQQAARISSPWTDATHATRTSKMALEIVSAGVAFTGLELRTTGAFAPSWNATGTAGAGFLELLTQSSPPAAPASGYREFADATGRPSWIRASDGFVRTWDATLTANRVYTLPDVSGTLALTSSTPTVLKHFVTDTATTGTVIETLASYAMPGGTLGTDGDSLHIQVWFKTAANANTKNFHVVFGATTVWTTSSVLNSGAVLVDVYVYRLSATTQKVIAWGNSDTSGYQAVTTTTPAETLSGVVTILIRATTATAAGDVMMRATRITKYPGV